MNPLHDPDPIREEVAANKECNKMQDATLDFTADFINVRDIIARVEELENDAETQEGEDLRESVAELAALRAILNKLKRAGGGKQWRGDSYPVTLIRDSHFIDYAQELAEDIGAIDANAIWLNNCINWEHAARNLQYDYMSVDIDGALYWYRR